MDDPVGQSTLDEARSTLDWWLTAGVDTMIDETPRNWLGPRSRSSEVPVAAEATSSKTDSSTELPADLPALRRLYETQPDLPFAGAGTTRVMPSGDPASDLMMIADMPTGEDTAAGFVFSGDCGLLFDRMLAAIGRTRQSIYLATLSCLAAPGGRLDAASADSCGQLARQHLKLVAPRRVLLLGEAATRVLTGLSLPAARGRVHAIDVGGDKVSTRVNAVATYHPRYLLTRPAAKAGAWSDLQLLMDDEMNGRNK